ncbi:MULTISPECIES: universal stress protein [unclassified Frankia]
MADIVVGVDGSAGSHTALRWAFTEAEWQGCGIRAVIGFARGTAQSGMRAGLAQAAERTLHKTVTAVTPPGSTVSVAEQAVDLPGAEALLTVGRDARMIVVGARGQGLLHRLRIGSVSASVAVHATVPVVIARGDVEAAIASSGATIGSGATAAEGTIPAGAPSRLSRPIAVGVDGSPNALSALAWAAGEAALRGVPLIAVHAWLAAIPLPFAEAPGEITQALEDQARAVLDESIAGVRDRGQLPAGLDLRAVVVPASATQALIVKGRECDLVVVGARGHGGFAELLLGSVSHQCMLHCPTPVAIIRQW